MQDKYEKAKNSIEVLLKYCTWDTFPTRARNRLIDRKRSYSSGDCFSSKVFYSASDSLRVYSNSPGWLFQWRSFPDRNLLVLRVYSSKKSVKIDVDELFQDINNISEEELLMMDMMYPEMVDSLSYMSAALTYENIDRVARGILENWRW